MPLTRWFWKVGIMDEIWVVTTVVVGLGLRMYDDLMIPITYGGDEPWSDRGMRFCWEDLDLTSLWVVLIYWDLRNRFGKLLINC